MKEIFKIRAEEVEALRKLGFMISHVVNRRAYRGSTSTGVESHEWYAATRDAVEEILRNGGEWCEEVLNIDDFNEL